MRMPALPHVEGHVHAHAALHEAIMDWYRGTGMRPYLQALDDASRKKFEGEVFAQVREEYPTQSDGSIIFPFPRFFFLATR